MEDNHLINLIISIVGIIIMVWLYLNFIDQLKQVNCNLNEIKNVLLENK